MTLEPTGKSSRSTEPLSTLPAPLHASCETRASSGESSPSPCPPAELGVGVGVMVGNSGGMVASVV